MNENILNVVFGDGIHDDASGLNELIRGRYPVYSVKHGRIIFPDDEAHIRGGKYMISKPLHIQPGRRMVFSDSVVIVGKNTKWGRIDFSK